MKADHPPQTRETDLGLETPNALDDTQQKGQAMRWKLSHRADKHALPIADRHYNRQKIGSPQFVPPGRCLVLLTESADALWVTSWPIAECVRHAWAGAWVCSCFRNESDFLSSELITEAVGITRGKWPDVPELGMITFVDSKKVRRKRDFGRCYLRAGFKNVGKTKGGLIALQLLPFQMPQAICLSPRVIEAQEELCFV